MLVTEPFWTWMLAGWVNSIICHQTVGLPIGRTGRAPTLNWRFVVEVISATTGWASSKDSASKLGVFDHVTNAWLVAAIAVTGTLITVFVWRISPRCTFTPARYSMTYH